MLQQRSLEPVMGPIAIGELEQPRGQQLGPLFLVQPLALAQSLKRRLELAPFEHHRYSLKP
jgi:hypothetical protein